jgi:hypothetical protein
MNDSKTKNQGRRRELSACGLGAFLIKYWVFGWGFDWGFGWGLSPPELT